MSCKKVEKRKSLRSVDMKRETSLRVHMGCSREKSFSCRHAAWTSTGWPWVNHVDLPEPVVELEHRRRGWGHRVCSVLKREGYRETYPLPAAAPWEGTQTVLKGAQRGRGALTRAATWDITWEYIQGKKLFIFREVKHWNRSPEDWLDFHPWRCSKLSCAWSWATWSDGMQAGQQDGLGDLCKSPPTYTILWSHLVTSVPVVPKISGFCLSISSAADDPDMEDRVTNKCLNSCLNSSLSISTSFHFAFSPCLKDWNICFSVCIGHFLCSSAFCISWWFTCQQHTKQDDLRKSRKHEEENKNYAEKEKHLPF